MKSIAEARIKRARALALVAEGHSYDEVAQAVGFAHRGSAHRAVFKALDEREAEDVDQLRAMEADRLDAMLAALWVQIESGDVAAITTALKITDRRIRLFGLDRGHEQHDLGPGQTQLVIGVPEGNPGHATTSHSGLEGQQ